MLPTTDAAHINVDKFLSGIISNASAMQGKCRIPQCRRTDAGDPNVDRHGLHVQAVLRNGWRARSQECVAPRSAIAANDVDFGVRSPQLLLDRLKQIELARIIGVHVARAVVTQEVVQARQGARDIPITDPVDDIDALARMGVKQAQPMLLSCWRGGTCGWGRGSFGGWITERKHTYGG